MVPPLSFNTLIQRSIKWVLYKLGPSRQVLWGDLLSQDLEWPVVGSQHPCSQLNFQSFDVANLWPEIGEFCDDFKTVFTYLSICDYLLVGPLILLPSVWSLPRLSTFRGSLPPARSLGRLLLHRRAADHCCLYHQRMPGSGLTYGRWFPKSPQSRPRWPSLALGWIGDSWLCLYSANLLQDLPHGEDLICGWFSVSNQISILVVI